MPHQFEPLLAARRYGATRILIADDVGLGKTVEAGLLLAELAGERSGFRALVLVPASLRDQWAQELDAHFSISVTAADAAWLRHIARSWPAYVNPWAMPGTYVASIDFLKRAEVLRAVEHLTWDLVVLDEAHGASGATDRRAAAHAVACRSKRVVLLTATPDLSDPARFAALCSIGQIDSKEAPIAFFRRTRADLDEGPPRRSTFIRVRPTPLEQRMHVLLEQYARRVWQEAAERRDEAAGLVAVLLRKRALSSARSLALSVRRRLELLARTPEASEAQLRLALGDEDEVEDAILDGELGAPGLADAAAERRMLEAIATAAAQASTAESKIRRLQRLLDRVREPVVVFTEYRDTLEHLERHLPSANRVVVCLHGGMDRVDRTRVQNRFNAGSALLLATDAAAEGLNLHHHCRIVVHFELPWRPARIAQRAGRVDRLGQRQRVREIALIGAASAERLVLAPLAARAARARMAGESSGLLDSLSELDVARLVQDSPSRPPDLSATSPPPQRMDLRREAEQEVDRLSRVRDAMVRSPLPQSQTLEASGVTMIARWRTRRLATAVHVVVRIAVSDTAGQILHEEGFALPLNGPRTVDIDNLRSLLSVIRMDLQIGNSAEADAIHRRASALLARVTELHRAGRFELEPRLQAMRALPSASQRLVQAGLFDRRPISTRPASPSESGALLAADEEFDTPRQDDELRVEVSIAGLLDARRRRA